MRPETLAVCHELNGGVELHGRDRHFTDESLWPPGEAGQPALIVFVVEPSLRRLEVPARP